MTEIEKENRLKIISYLENIENDKYFEPNCNWEEIDLDYGELDINESDPQKALDKSISRLAVNFARERYEIALKYRNKLRSKRKTSENKKTNKVAIIKNKKVICTVLVVLFLFSLLKIYFKTNENTILLDELKNIKRELSSMTAKYQVLQHIIKELKEDVSKLKNENNSLKVEIQKSKN